MKLFAEVYLDEDVSVLIATLLRARGFDAVTTRDEGMLGQDDPDQLAHAVSLGRCIVTHNRVHFERLYDEYLVAGQKHYGIIIASRRSPYEVARPRVSCSPHPLVPPYPPCHPTSPSPCPPVTPCARSYT